MSRGRALDNVGGATHLPNLTKLRILDGISLESVIGGKLQSQKGNSPNLRTTLHPMIGV